MKNKAKVLLVDDDELIVSMLSRVLKGEGYETAVLQQPGEVVRKVRAWSPDMLLLDVRLPGRSGIEILEDIVRQGLSTQVVMLTADDTAETAVRALKLGAVDYLTKPFNTDEVRIVVRNIIEKGNLKREVDYLRRVQEQHDRPIVGKSPLVLGLLAQIDKMAEAAVDTVLITGESGTGKELVARYAHQRIRRGPRFAPFIRINCAALPETLLESELFGYEKGSFTDAKSDRKGLFETAQGGSLLLDEIGEMKPNLQAKLLRVLEERTIRPIGGSEEIPVDVTVIATTNRNLSEAVERGQFRMDLWYRLNAFHLQVPPLRERRDDIPVLASHFLGFFADRYNKKPVKTLSAEAETVLRLYRWPGNIRELRNLLERIVVLESAEEIRPEHLPDWLQEQKKEEETKRADGMAGVVLPAEGIALEAVEQELIRQALERTQNNKMQAAKLLGITYDTLRYQVKKFGLD